MGCRIPAPPLWALCCLVNCSAVPQEHFKRKKKTTQNPTKPTTHNCVKHTVLPIFLNGRYPKPLSAAEKSAERTPGTAKEDACSLQAGSRLRETAELLG